MANILQKIINAGKSLKKMVDDDEKEPIPDIPTVGSKDADEKLPTMIQEMWKESKDFRAELFRNRNGHTGSPAAYWKNMRLLEGGQHWKVWVSRTVGLNNAWKHELVDDEIANQIRVRKSHITSAWHDVDVIPNISNISEILNQERAATDWSRQIKLGVHKAMVEGTSWFKTILDLTKDASGSVREVVMNNESVFLTPHATGIEEIEGNWYLIHATMQNFQTVKHMYPKFDTSELKELKADVEQEIRYAEPNMTMLTSKYTKEIDHLECWMDDDRLVQKPFSTDITDQEHAIIAEGKSVEVHPLDHHPKHIQAHLDWLQTVETASPQETRTPEDEQVISAIEELAQTHIEEHQRAMQGDDLGGSRMKMYPYGRKLVLVGGKIAEDIQNPYMIPWRRLFHRLPCEDIGEQYGRGMGEVLWNTNFLLDTMLSRIADASVTVSNPKPWMNVADKDMLEEQHLNNDPTQIGFYTVSAPQFPNGQSPQEPMLIYNVTKENSSKSMGINDVTYGKSPGAKSSGDLVEMLIRQNVVLVTGELQVNLNNVVADIIETRLSLMRIFYTEPRQYYIDGQLQMVNVSRLLSVRQGQDENGQPIEEPIGDFQVVVKPNSNLPNEWEGKLQMFQSLYANVDPADGTHLIPREAVLDVLAEKYPNLGVNGKYYQMGQVMQLGMQAMQQKQQEQAKLDQIKQKMEAKGLQAITS